MTKTSHSIIKRSAIGMAAASIAAASFVSMALAGERPKAAAACPANFFSVATVWYDNTTKTTVSARSTTPDRAEIADRRGWTLGDLCQHIDTGDVRIYDRKPLDD